MEALTGNNLLVTLLVMVAVMEFINLLGKTIDTFRGWWKPAKENDSDVQNRLETCERKLEQDFKQLQDVRNGQRELCFGVQALLNHELHNGNADEMAHASENINKWLVGRK